MVKNYHLVSDLHHLYLLPIIQAWGPVSAPGTWSWERPWPAFQSPNHCSQLEVGECVCAHMWCQVEGVMCWFWDTSLFLFRVEPVQCWRLAVAREEEGQFLFT